MDYTALLAAYGLAPTDLSPERKGQLEDILRGAGQAAGRVALEKATEILRQEAAKRGLGTGNAGTQTGKEAEAAALEEARRLADEAAASQRRNWLIGIGAAVVVVIGIVITLAVRRRNK